MRRSGPRMGVLSAVLTLLDQLPHGLLELPAQRLHERLSGPTLIHLPGRRAPSLFVAVLQHGNETTGWEAVRRLLIQYQNRELPRAMSLFIGNVAAARHGLRRLDHQPDYNRVWPGGLDNRSPESAMARQIVEQMERRGLFAAVDVHNNTGHNPHYACVNVLEHRFFQLATLFSRTVVYFITTPGVASMALARLCPSVTLECGQPGFEHSVAHALEYLDACLNLAEIPSHPVSPQDLDLFHTVAVVRVHPECSLGFGATDTDLRLTEDLDRLNFQELPPGTVLGWRRPGGPWPLVVIGEDGQELGAQYLDATGDEIRLVRPVMPSMLTLDPRIIRQDCLCYLMERYPLELARPNPVTATSS